MLSVCEVRWEIVDNSQREESVVRAILFTIQRPTPLRRIVSAVESHVAEPTARSELVQCSNVFDASLAGTVSELGEERAKCVQEEPTHRDTWRGPRNTVLVCRPMWRCCEHELLGRLLLERKSHCHTVMR